MNQKRILLHIGSPKCGSTYLQRVMLQNTKTLRADGIHYPHDGQAHPGNAAKLEKVTASCLDAMFEPEIHSIVLSHEDLFMQPQRGKSLARLAKQREIEITPIVFLRPFSDFIFGDYSQFMKQNFHKYLKTRQPYEGRTFEEFAVARERAIPITTALKSWEKCFANTQLKVHGHHNIRSVTESWLNTTTPLKWEVPRDITNPSLRIQDCEALVEALQNPENSDAGVRKLLKHALHNVDTPDPGRTAERRKWIEALFQRHNKNLQTLFGFDNRLRN